MLLGIPAPRLASWRKMTQPASFVDDGSFRGYPVCARVFTKVAFGISRKSKFYTEMGLISRNFE
jgi:hypothetical protein